MKPFGQLFAFTSFAFYYIFRLFTYGIGMQVDRLYSQIEFPVSRGTPMIGPLIKYDHELNWTVPNLSTMKNNLFERKVTIDIAQEEYSYLAGHIIDGNYLQILNKIILVFDELNSSHFQNSQNAAHCQFRPSATLSGRHWVCKILNKTFLILTLNLQTCDAINKLRSARVLLFRCQS